jgi:UDP-N-acetylglucosamine--N-acetylmuramyl-(pentapeptide) pyrophosphoryl-undecaprenol N-acetylglucosamine transferase
VLRSIAETVGWFHSLAPELVVVTGGYAGAPAGVAAFLMGIPLVLQEANALPGVTTRLLARAATQIHVGYAEAIDLLPWKSRARAVDTGNPVRPTVRRGVERVRSQLGLLPDRSTLLVVGGSQGSVALNRSALEMVEAVPGDPGFQILWATGPRWEADVRAALGERVREDWLTVTGYLDDMPAALEAADLAVSRAGAMTTSEFLTWGLPAILVPLPTSAEDHQTRNALALEAAGCATHLPQSEATGAVLLDRVRSLVADAALRESMAARALERARPEAAEQIAEALSSLLRKEASA